MDLQIQLALIGSFQAILVAVIGFVAVRDSKKRQKADAITKNHAERSEERAEQRKKESLLAMKMTSANMNLGIATAIAVKNHSANGEMDAALSKAKEVADEYKDFLEEIASAVRST